MTAGTSSRAYLHAAVQEHLPFRTEVRTPTSTVRGDHRANAPKDASLPVCCPTRPPALFSTCQTRPAPSQRPSSHTCTRVVRRDSGVPRSHSPPQHRTTTHTGSPRPTNCVCGHSTRAQNRDNSWLHSPRPEMHPVRTGTVVATLEARLPEHAADTRSPPSALTPLPSTRHKCSWSKAASASADP